MNVEVASHAATVPTNGVFHCGIQDKDEPLDPAPVQIEQMIDHRPAADRCQDLRG